METNNDYNFSLFKPKTDYTRRVRNIIVSMILFWALAVFGFQILLKVTEKPTPEKTFTAFESVWDNIKVGNASFEENRIYIQSLAAVLGKSSVKPDKKLVLSKALSWRTYCLLDSSQQQNLAGLVQTLISNREALGKTKTDNDYMQAKQMLISSKNDLIKQIAELHKIPDNSLDAGIIAYNLSPSVVQQLNLTDLEALPGIMKLYLIHNQSYLTNARFLGFPFHYFYTAELLLIIFVLLSLIYSLRIQRLQKRFNIVE